MHSKFLTLIGGITGFFVFPMSALASCAEYPYKIIGAKLIPLENDNVKVISTYKVGVNFDDTDEVVDEEESFNIDYPWEFEMAELKYKNMIQYN